PLERFPSVERQRSSVSPKLRILFGGAVELRRGIPYLLEALRLLHTPCIEAKFVVPVALSAAKLQPYQDVATFLGPVSRAQMSDLYRRVDLFVFPFLCDGFGLVVYEALASGLPVIVTPNTGADVRDGIDGLVVPIRDVEALAAAVERFLHDREFYQFCHRNILADRDRFGLDAYKGKLVKTIREATARALKN